jgi:hypothetical protein
MATAAWIAGSLVATGGLTALAIKKVSTGKAPDNLPTIPQPKEDHHG